MRALELKQMRKSYQADIEVLKGIDIVIEPGEFFVLVGPSGCGKSTLLRMIAGLEEISSGELYIGGAYANKLKPSQRELSMVFQNYALFPHMTVEQNIAFGLHVKKLTKVEQSQRCQEAAEMLGLTPYLKRKPRELSGGQRQRVALARAIVTQDPICLMDEPLSNLDAKLRTKMRSEIRQLQRKLGITMIYVTHDQTEAMTMADRMMILNQGEVQQVGKPLDIYNHPANTFVASFIGAPPMNMVNGYIQNGNVHLPCDTTLPKIHQDLAGEFTIGIRPEHLVRATNTDEATLHATVTNVEMLGTETLINFQLTEKLQWTARWQGQHAVPLGEKVSFAIKAEDLVFFDDQTKTNTFLEGAEVI
ncbi:sn-glycerol-3-phosphate ABC transporter ATP-binding protein UgpC [Cytobacillus sp. Sa5YUA1]|uniref:Sn-glycerol-3-phosphate ABC transporter ATP-binding protein UgpC n=1 Tax=Cytobacillus stercorigallinarum TaxID=2762240 RepID=A0ABR8QS93_9BACI|nr:sn-glycerol-3-phosphate ABC transporter ATP-binding protein UgpC [Cytobacillus stercorigallinarum]MBD7938279.1 sn-glycerol-3-phosphate ABC transporter ATP-binding protein UgpC [Cytobacillus stercorigallinarum]